jgi:hypothetical protein
VIRRLLSVDEKLLPDLTAGAVDFLYAQVSA